MVKIGDTDPSTGLSAEQSNAINLIAHHNPAYEGTSIGAGLEMATDEIKNFGLSDGIPPGSNNSGTPDPFRVVILLSDGGEDAPPLYAATPPAVSQVSQDLTNEQIVVYTVGIGNGIDAALLARIRANMEEIINYQISRV